MVNSIIVLKYDIITGQIIGQLRREISQLWEQTWFLKKLRLIDFYLKISKIKNVDFDVWFWAKIFLALKSRKKGMKKIIIMKHTEM